MRHAWFVRQQLLTVYLDTRLVVAQVKGGGLVNGKGRGMIEKREIVQTDSGCMMISMKRGVSLPQVLCASKLEHQTPIIKK